MPGNIQIQTVHKGAMTLDELLDAKFGTKAGTQVCRGANLWQPSQLSVIPILIATDGATVTFDLSLSSWWQVTLAGSRIFALANASVFQQFSIRIIQGGSGSNTVTWFSAIKWAGGGAPTLTTSVGGIDVVTFKGTALNTYDGYVAGAALA